MLIGKSELVHITKIRGDHSVCGVESYSPYDLFVNVPETYILLHVSVTANAIPSARLTLLISYPCNQNQ